VLDALTGVLRSSLQVTPFGELDVFSSATGQPRLVTADPGGSGFSLWDLGAGHEDAHATPPPTLVRQAARDLPGINCIVVSEGPLPGGVGPRIFTGFISGNVTAWDGEGVCLRAFHPPSDVRRGEVCVLKACPDRLVSGHSTGLICVWDVGALGDGGEAPVMPVSHMQQPHEINRMEILECEDGSRRVLAGDTVHNAMLWDVDTGALMMTIPLGWVSGCFLPLEQPDGAYHAVVAGWGGQVRVVDLGERAPGSMVRSALKLG
jgi:WD40 repeat protein